MSENVYYYQSIPELGIKGRMNTPEEFERIGLPESVAGMPVLDIGCNIGAFLYECHKRGASFLYGVEPNTDWRLLAKGVLNEIERRKVHILPSIEELHPNDFGLVLLLSVTHLIHDPQQLLDIAWEKTRKGGLMIVEVNDRLQGLPIELPEGAVLYGKNKDNRSVYHCVKNYK